MFSFRDYLFSKYLSVLLEKHILETGETGFKASIRVTGSETTKDLTMISKLDLANITGSIDAT